MFAHRTVRFSPERALGHARKLAFPRLSGTKGEEAARSLIISEIESLGLAIQAQSFPLGPRPWSLYKISLFLGLLLLWWAWWLQERELVSFFLVLAFLPGTLLSTRLWLMICQRGMLRRRGGRVYSQNLIVPMPGAAARPNQLFLLAHYDSKSQNIPLLVRIAFTGLMGISVFLLALLFLLTGIGILSLDSANPAINLFALVAGACIVPFLFQQTENKSPGALDNAAAVGVIIELIRYFERSLPKNLGLTFLFVGAEEEGLQGSLAFLASKEKELDRRGCYFINLEGIGAPGKLLVTTSTGFLSRGGPKALVTLLKDVSRETRIPLYSFPLLPGLTMDHVPFSARGFNAASIFGLSKASFTVHTPRDTPELLSGEAIEKVGALLLAAVGRLDAS